ncbi:aldehyde dehydrogenase [Stenotrophomonas maltophilia]|nr:aldehyde dehydrogenase [Stenotrophomonas maltophilia]
MSRFQTGNGYPIAACCVRRECICTPITAASTAETRFPRPAVTPHPSPHRRFVPCTRRAPCPARKPARMTLSQQKTFDQWLAAAASLRIEARAFINGQYVNARSGKTFHTRSPIDGRTLADVADCGQQDVDEAVAAAQRAFEARNWSGRTPAQRKQVLLRLAALIEQHQEELALLESLDSGKTIRESLDMDMQDVALAFRYYAEAIDKRHDLIAPTGDGFHGMITREPIGVVAGMTPWNNPLMIAAWKIAPTLACGNSMVFKPSEKAPLTAIRLGQLARDAGLPDGVLNIVPGAVEVGQALALHPHVGALTFTGSSTVAKQLLVHSGNSNMKRLVLEGSGKNAHIVFADTPDLAKAARFAALGFCANQGEVCASGTRLFVENPIKEAFLQLLAQEVEHWTPGHPLDPAATMGALIDEGHLDRVKRYVDSAVAEGARLLSGGERILSATGGTYFPPTIIADATRGMTAVREEIFGPVVTVLGFDTEEEVIALANDSEYGLTAGFWTPDVTKVHRVARQLQAGTVWVNHFLTRDILSPFGGYKQSGFGRDLSLLAMDQYTEIKSTWIALGDVAGH